MSMGVLAFFILQIDWERFRPESILGAQVLERTPAGLSVIYLGSLAVLLALLALSFIGNVSPSFSFERDLPREVKRRLGLTSANRSLRLWQIVFVLLATFVYGFHVYWTYYADDYNEQFQQLSYKDLRYRRVTAAALRGWMFDRTGKLSSALAYYKKEQDGDIIRAFSLEKEMAHLLGNERGAPGLERTLFQRAADPMPEAWEVFTTIKQRDDDKHDVRLTIDRDLQAFIAQQLKEKNGAIVVLNPQTGDILAVYSNPSFNLAQAQDLENWLQLEADKRNKPLLNRAMREFYVPGSTFKTFTMIGAFRTGKQNITFTSLPGGFVPFRGSKPILDANGGCEPPYGCTNLNIAQAYEASSNQFFSQMAVELGRERIRETAGYLGIAAVDSPSEAVNTGLFPEIINASQRRIQNAIAPQQSTIVTGKDISNYDIGLEGMGQGYAGQMTPFQMAMIAAAAGNLEGKLMKPRIEFNQPPEAYSQVLSAQQANAVREIMALVTEGSGGTARSVFAGVRGQGIRVGGKTGTAEKQSPLYDAKTGLLKTITKQRRDKEGNLVNYKVPVLYERTDSWFICIAPLEKPQLSIAVVVEGGGYGSRVAAPIAANVVLKARDLGLLGENYKPKPVETNR